jgi:carbonic anhydrase
LLARSGTISRSGAAKPTAPRVPGKPLIAVAHSPLNEVSAMSSSRREFLRVTGTAVAGVLLTSEAGAQAAAPGAAPAPIQEGPSGEEALRMLLDGNGRFVAGRSTRSCHSPDDFNATAEGETPIAVIVGCADSRVSPEILFDQGVGDLFVVRVAGNVVTGAGGTVKGSIEYAVAELGVPLIVVLGHSNCGAVRAAIKHVDANDTLPGAIAGLVALIKPAVLKSKGESGDKLDNAIRANVDAGVARLRTLEPIVAKAVQQGKVQVVGATYDLRTGKVTVQG